MTCGILPIFPLSNMILSAIISIKSKTRAIYCRVTLSADVIVGFTELSACLNVHYRVLLTNNQSRMSTSL